MAERPTKVANEPMSINVPSSASVGLKTAMTWKPSARRRSRPDTATDGYEGMSKAQRKILGIDPAKLLSEKE